jgi:hypothetical protein
MTMDAAGTTVSPQGDEEGSASRSLMAGALLVAVAWVAFVVLVRPRGRPWESLWQFGQVMTLLGSFAASVLGTRPRPGPARFVVRDGVAFVVPASRAWGYLVAGIALSSGFVAAAAAGETGLGPTPSAIDYGFAVIFSVVSLAVLGVPGFVVFVALRRRPYVELTPRGVVVREMFGNRAIPWEALRPGLPQRLGNSQLLTLTVDRPDLVVRKGLVGRAPRVFLTYGRIHPWLLVDAIRHYADHPERRPAIGTRAEHERLLAELGVRQ